MSAETRADPAADHRETVRVLRPDGTVEECADVATAVAARGDASIVWVDLVAPTAELLDEVARGLCQGVDLHPLLVEDVFEKRHRAKIDRYDDHVFVDLVDIDALDEAARPTGDYARILDLPGGDTLVASPVSAILFDTRVITVRKRADALDAGRICGDWSGATDERRDGPGLFLHSVLDQLVDRIVSVTAVLADDVDELEQAVVERNTDRSVVQERAFMLRKASALVRRVAMPTREVVGQVLRRDGRGFLTAHVDDANVPYLHDVYDHAIRVAESLDDLRDELTSILEFNMSLQDTELNEVMKKLSAWAAIIAVPTAVTGYFGQNLPYPGYDQTWGFWVSVAMILAGAIGLWFWFRKLGWL